METTDTALLADSRRGHTAAFATLVERYQNLVCAVTYSMTGDRELSEDLAQETFLTAWRSLSDLREPERFRGWLCGIARNLGSKARRRMGRTTALPHDGVASDPASGLVDDRDGPEDALAARESEALVWRVLERIPDTYREPLVLYYREGRSAAQVAEALGLSVSAVEQRLSRGRRQLARDVEMVVERTLERSRPAPGFAAAVVAALPQVPIASTLDAGAESGGGPGVEPGEAGTAHGIPGRSSPSTASSSPAPWGVARRSTAMKTMIAATLALAVGSAGYGLSTAWDDADDEAAGTVAADGKHSRDVASEATAHPGSDARAEHRDRAATRARMRAEREQGGAAQAVGDSADTNAIPHYELSRLSPVQFTVNLDGGPSPLKSGYSKLGLPEPAVPTIVRTIRGRVLDAEGHGVAGAVVIGGERLTCATGKSMSSQAGTVSAADGTYALELGHGELVRLVAMHRDEGWSTITSVTAGTHDVELDLPLAPAATLEGTVTRDDAPLESDVWLRLADTDEVRIRIPTDAQGRYHTKRLPPGSFEVTAALPLGAGLGSLPQAKLRVTLRPGVASTLDIDVPVGAFIAVVADLPPEIEEFNARYTMLTGEHVVADPEALHRLRHALPRDQVQSFSHGGVDAENVAQFNDVPAGRVTICVEVGLRRGDAMKMACEITEAGEPGDDSAELHLRPLD